MSTLHTINKSPFERSSFSSALTHLRSADALLLIEDAVLAARRGSAFAVDLEKAARSCAIYVLAPDLAARGIEETNLIPKAKVVDYGGFVDLVIQHQRTQAWL